MRALCSGISFKISEYPCANDEFYCGQGKCIILTWLCDLIPDCFDAKDEEFCDVCPRSQFNCHNGECIDPNLMCNGENDCGNQVDELGCPGKEIVFPHILSKHSKMLMTCCVERCSSVCNSSGVALCDHLVLVEYVVVK